MTGLMGRPESGFREELAIYKSRSMKRRVESWTSVGRELRFLGFDSAVSAVDGAHGVQLHREAQETHCAATEAQGRVPPLPIAASGSGRAGDQPDAAWLGDYFAVGHSSACFSFIKDWVEKKVRRHMLRARNARASAGRGGVGLAVRNLKLFNSYGFGARAESRPAG